MFFIMFSYFNQLPVNLHDTRHNVFCGFFAKSSSQTLRPRPFLGGTLPFFTATILIPCTTARVLLFEQEEHLQSTSHSMATSGKPSTWFPLGELVEQSPPPADIFAAVHFTSSTGWTPQNISQALADLRLSVLLFSGRNSCSTSYFFELFRRLKTQASDPPIPSPGPPHAITTQCAPK